MKIVRAVRRLRMKDQHTDFAFWQGLPYEARLRALEEIRRDYHRWKYGGEPRLKRAGRIVDAKSGRVRVLKEL